jgi:hypothetical protein
VSAGTELSVNTPAVAKRGFGNCFGGLDEEKVWFGYPKKFFGTNN